MKLSIDRVDQHLSRGSFGQGRDLAKDALLVTEALSSTVASACSVSEISTPPPSVSRIVWQSLVEASFVDLQRGDISAASDRLRRARLFCEAPIGSTYASETGTLSPIRDWDNEAGILIKDTIRASMAQDGFSKGIEFLEPSPSILNMCEAAHNILCRLIPQVWKDTRPGVLSFALMESELESAYNSETPRMFLINIRMFADLLMAADTLLHESLHQKIGDIRATNISFRDQYDDRISESQGDVLVPWGKGAPRKFSIARAASTYHVYVHSSLLYASALLSLPEESDENGFGIPTSEVARRLKRSLDRANFLGAALTTVKSKNTFSADLNRFVAWLNDAVFSIADLNLTTSPNRFADTSLQLV